MQSKDIIFFEPVPRHAIWGGDVLKEYFGYEGFPPLTGQCWAFSAQEGEGLSTRALGAWEGETLRTLFKGRPELFRSRYGEFPFIISLVGPVDDLSIQVHPDDAYARNAGLPGGKNEAWVFLKTPEDYDIVFNHNASSPEELQRYIDEGRWAELICHLPVRAGDGVYIPAGTLHAMRAGAVTYEIQQAVDVTYRFYDYDRRDAQGKARPLQLEDAKKCLKYRKADGVVSPSVQTAGGAEVTTYISNESFTVRRLAVRGEALVPFDRYAVATVTAGSGTVDGMPVKKGDNFLIAAGKDVCPMGGAFELMMTQE